MILFLTHLLSFLHTMHHTASGLEAIAATWVHAHPDLVRSTLHHIARRCLTQLWHRWHERPPMIWNKIGRKIGLSKELITDGYWSVEEVAAFLGISVKRLKQRVSEGRDHPPKAPGENTWKFRKVAFDKWVQQNERHEVCKRRR